MLFRFVLLTYFSSTLLLSSVVMDRVQEFVDRDSFLQHYSLINKLFANEDRFINGDRVDQIAIIERLKTSGILKLYLDQPQPIEITFSGGGEPIFFMKLLSDSLQELGYFHYKVLETSLNSDGLSWKIEFVSDYLLDPILLYESLSRKGCQIVDIERISLVRWSYKVDIGEAYLNVQPLTVGEKVKLKTPVFDYWFQVDGGKVIEFISIANNWHPYITFYDSRLNIINIFKKDYKRMKLRLKIPNGAKYIKVTDIYLLNNIKNGLRVSLE